MIEDTVVEAERRLLGAMMLSPDAVWAAAEIVKPADFHEPRHELIGRVLFDLATGGGSVDALAVSDELSRRGHLRGALDAAYVFALTDEVFTASSAGHYAAIVVRHSKLRRLRVAASQIIESSESGEDVDRIVNDARSLIDSAVDDSSSLSSVGESMRRVIEELDSGETPFVPTRWRELNHYLHGLKPGTLNIIAGRPGGGKTIMGLLMAADLAETGLVSFSSLEMGESDLIKRLIAAEADVHLTGLSKNELTRDEWMRVQAAQAHIDEMGLFIDDRANVTMEQIAARAKKVARRGPLAGVVVDYMQLMRSGRRVESRQQEVSEFSRALKLLAKELQVPVIALSQINRDSEKNRRLPAMSDLRESGAIEQDADTIILLARRVDKDGNRTDEVDAVIGKNRNGPSGRTTLLWEGQYGRLSSLPWGRFAAPPVDVKAAASGD